MNPTGLGDTASGLLTIAALLAVLALAYVPVGDYLTAVLTPTRHLRVERGLYRLLGVDPDGRQNARSYALAVVALSLISILALTAILMGQSHLPFSRGMAGLSLPMALNTAVSFVTNTNWQSYAGESTLGYVAQAAGLTVQNFVSAAVGIAVAAALLRGLAARRGSDVGSFWVDLIRINLRLLLPLAVIVATVLMLCGVIQNLEADRVITTVAGGQQTLPGGPVASQEAIKLLGTNGGGFFNANSAHPFENPTGWTNLLQILLILVIPFALPRTFGRMIDDNRQGYAIAAVMGTIFLISTFALSALELAGRGSAPELAGAAMEGKEARFGILGSTLFGSASTLTSTGAVNSMHDSYTALGGMMPMLDMMLGEVAPGGVGSGLYGMLVLAIIAVFVGGLLVGRTPEYLGKRIGPKEIKLASLYILVTPTLVLVGTALSFAIPGIRADVEATSILNPGVHGMSEVLYAFTSASNNNGSAFAGLTANTPWFNTALGVAMLLGRFIPIVLVLALAGSLAAQERVPATAGTLPTHRPQFVGLLVGVTVIVTALTYFPVLTLGPLAEGLN
jgi:K+-transporting ATPase ATPase A chain